MVHHLWLRAGTLSLMDVGVPMKAPVSGIAMGLIKNPGEEYAVLERYPWR